MIGSYFATGGIGSVSVDLSGEAVLGLRVGPAGIIQLPSRDLLDEEAVDSAVNVDSREPVREGKSIPVGEDPSDSGSSVRVLVEESSESLEAGGRSSRASCLSNWAIGDGETSDGGSECIKGQRVSMMQEVKEKMPRMFEVLCVGTQGGRTTHTRSPAKQRNKSQEGSSLRKPGYASCPCRSRGCSPGRDLL